MESGSLISKVFDMTGKETAMLMGDLRIAHAVRDRLVKSVPVVTRQPTRRRPSGLVPVRQEAPTCAECPAAA